MSGAALEAFKQISVGSAEAEQTAANRLLAALPAEALALLEPDLKRVTLDQGALCFYAGDAVDYVYFPRTGMISLSVKAGNAKMVEIALVGCDGAVGLQCGLGPRRLFTRAIVLIAGEFSVIAADRFEQAAGRSAAIKDLIVRYTELQWTEAQQTTACNALHDGSSRLCRWLLQSADRTRSENVPLTQEFLAEMLGLRRTTVTLLAQELQKKGILRYSRGKITIVDRPALEAAACDCYGIIRRESLSLTNKTKI